MARVSTHREEYSGRSTNNSVTAVSLPQCPFHVLLSLFQRTMVLPSKEQLSMSSVMFSRKVRKAVYLPTSKHFLLRCSGVWNSISIKEFLRFPLTVILVIFFKNINTFKRTKAFISTVFSSFIYQGCILHNRNWLMKTGYSGRERKRRNKKEF